MKFYPHFVTKLGQTLVSMYFSYNIRVIVFFPFWMLFNLDEGIFQFIISFKAITLDHKSQLPSYHYN